MDTIYANNQASTVYFITLTLAADILCIALIVAVGAKHYKQFAGSILHQRLVDRRHAVSCAFRAVASCNTTIHDVDEVGVGAQDDEKSITSDAESYKQQQYEEDFNHSGKRELRVSKEDWICMCSHMTGKYAPTPHNAAFIFDLVVDGDPREHIDDSGEVYKKFVLHLDEFLFFRCCALVSTRVVIQVEAPVLLPDSEQSGESDNDSSTTGSGVELPSRLSTMESATYTGENIGLSLPADKNVITLISPTIGAAQKRHSATGSDIDQQSSTQERTSSHGSAKTSQERLSSLQNPSNYKVAMLAVDADVGPRERRSSLKVLRVSERSPAELRQSPTLSLLARPSRQIAGASYFEAQFHCVLDFLYYYLQPLRDVCVHITGANVTVGGDTGGIRQKYTINLFYAVNIFLLLLLVSHFVLVFAFSVYNAYFSLPCS